LRLFENFYRVIQSEERHFEEAIASFDYAKFKWTPDLENAVDSDEQTADGLVDFNITGQVLKISSREAEVDCFGGDTIFMLRARTRGDWNMLKVGTWFKGTAWISESGEVYRATIDEEIPPLDSIHDGELDDFYNRIMRGEFTSKK
jgi:hypothetical protein